MASKDNVYTNPFRTGDGNAPYPAGLVLYWVTNTILSAVTYGGGTFVAVGLPLFLSTGFSTILTSQDGLTWASRAPGSVQTLRGAAYGNGTFVAVGDQGTILQSGLVTESSLIVANGLGPAGFELSVFGAPGHHYTLQASTNLNAAGWIDLVAFTNTQPMVSLVDTTAAFFPRRFYRVWSP